MGCDGTVGSCGNNLSERGVADISHGENALDAGHHGPVGLDESGLVLLAVGYELCLRYVADENEDSVEVLDIGLSGFLVLVQNGYLPNRS